MLFNAWRHVLASMRHRRNFSQRQAAQMAGVSKVTWSRWEQGTSRPRVSHLEGIARGAGCSLTRVGFEYSRLLYRHYCQELGYECPAPRPIAGASVASSCRSHLESGRPIPNLNRGACVTRRA